MRKRFELDAWFPPYFSRRPRGSARVCTHVLLAAILSRALGPLRPLAGGEGGARRGSGGRVRWAVPPLRPRGLPHLTPTLSAPKGGEGDFGSQMCACPSAGAGAQSLPMAWTGGRKARGL